MIPYPPVCMIDESPYLEYLDQFKDSTNTDEKEHYIEDQKRKSQYGVSWHMVGIRAEVEILINNVSTQTIVSAGIWSIESDSGDEYIREACEKTQFPELVSILESLNVDTSNFGKLCNQAKIEE